MFLLAGRVLHRYRTADIAGVSGLLRSMPWTGGAVRGRDAGRWSACRRSACSSRSSRSSGRASRSGRPWLMGLVLALLDGGLRLVLGHTNRMLYGAPRRGVAVGEGGRWPLVPLGVCVAALVVLGLFVPAPLATLLRQIAEIVGPMTRLTELAAALSESSRAGSPRCGCHGTRELRCTVAAGAVPALAGWLRASFGAELVLMVGADRRARPRGGSRSTTCSATAARTGSSTPRLTVSADAPDDPVAGHVPLSGLAVRARDLRPVRDRGRAGTPTPGPLVRHAFWPADYFPLRKDAVPREFHDDGRAFPFTAGRRRGRLRDPGGPGARRHHRARPLPLQRRGRDDHRHEVAAVLHPQGHREALRGARARGRRGAGRARVRRHERRPRARLLPGGGGARRRRRAGPGAVPPRDPARDGAPLQPRGRLRR